MTMSGCMSDKETKKLNGLDLSTPQDLFSVYWSETMRNVKCDIQLAQYCGELFIIFPF